MNFFKKLFHKAPAKLSKPVGFDPTDWQTIVRIAIAVLTLLASLLGGDLGTPGGPKEGAEGAGGEPPANGSGTD